MKKLKSDKKVRICPNCGGLKLKSFLTIGPQEISRWVITNNKHFEGVPSNTDCFLCKNCDYLGICPEIEINKIKEFRKNLKKTDRQNYQQKPKKLTKWQVYLSILGLVLLCFVIINLFLKSDILFGVIIATIVLYIVSAIFWIIYRIVK